MPNWREKLTASVHNEVPRDEVDAYRRAGRAAYDYATDLEMLRAGDPSSPAVQAALLAGWAALALQILGDQALDAAASAHPSRAHYLPGAIAEQLTRLYRPVRRWLTTASEARANPGYVLKGILPEELPDWVEGEPATDAELAGLRSAVALLAEQLNALLDGWDPGERYSPARDLVAQRMAEVSAALEYVDRLGRPEGETVSAGVRKETRSALRTAAETYFHLGQVVCMPSLHDRPVHPTALRWQTRS